MKTVVIPGGSIWLDWVNTALADMAELGSIGSNMNSKCSTSCEAFRHFREIIKK